MSVPVIPPPPDPSAPPATAGVTVIAKNSEQQRRSALYTWLAALGLGLPPLLDALGKLAPSLKRLFPKHADAIGAICEVCGALGIAMLAGQRTGSIKNTATVNFTER